jgi:hypothetical protein
VLLRYPCVLIPVQNTRAWEERFSSKRIAKSGAPWSVILVALKLLTCPLVFAQNRSASTPLAETSAGKLRGETQPGLSVFRGIEELPNRLETTCATS